MSRNVETGSRRDKDISANHGRETDLVGQFPERLLERSMDELMDQRLNLLSRLSASFAPPRTGTTPSEITRLEQRTGEQCELLHEWVRLEVGLEKEARRMDPLPMSGAAGRESDSHPDRQRQRRLLVEIQGKCMFEMAVLRRDRRTAGALRALLSMQDLTYTAARPM